MKAFKYRIYPTKQQEVLIAKHIGASRFVYNLALETKQMAYSGSRVNLSRFDISNQIPELKKECPWLKEVNAQSLQKAITHMDSAFNNFFKGHAKFPKFKSKKSSKQSFGIPQNVELNVDSQKLVLPKFKQGISIRLHRPIKGKVKQATISRTPIGKYFASILVETGEVAPNKIAVIEQTAIGIDLGIKSFLIGSDGSKFDNPRHLKKTMSRLKFIQSRYDKFKGKRTKYKLAKLHEEVANKRRDFLHRVSSHLVKNHDSIAIEDLNVSEMMKNHSFAQAISDCGWSIFVEMLEYKAEWQGKNILRIGRFEPSSKMCSSCGHVNKQLQISDREWTCKKCMTHHDRDVNAAKNIKAFALEKHVCGTQTKTCSELPTLVGVLTCEASSI